MIQGKRVTLKMLEPQDMPLVMELLSMPDVTKYLMQNTAELTVNSIGQFLCYTTPGTQSLPMGIFRTDTGEFLGFTVISEIHPVNRSAMCRFIAMKPTVWREGFGVDAVFHLFSHLFLERNLRRIWGTSIADNEPVGIAIQKLGFRLEGVEKKHSWFDGKWADRKIWGCLKKEFNWGLFNEPEEEAQEQEE